MGVHHDQAKDYQNTIHTQDTSHRQDLYLKLKMMKSGAQEAFLTIRSVPCQWLMGGGL